MTKLDQYLANAEHCREILQFASHPRHRLYIEEMIATWEMMARALAAKQDRAAQRAATTTGGQDLWPAAVFGGGSPIPNSNPR